MSKLFFEAKDYRGMNIAFSSKMKLADRICLINMASFVERSWQSFSKLIYCLLSNETSNILQFNWKDFKRFVCAVEITENSRKSFTNRFLGIQETVYFMHVLGILNAKATKFPPLVPWNIRRFIEFWLEILCGWLENWQLELWFHKRKKGWTPHDMFLSLVFCVFSNMKALRHSKWTFLLCIVAGASITEPVVHTTLSAS